LANKNCKTDFPNTPSEDFIPINCSVVRGPGIFGEIEISWNISAAADTEFEETSGKVVMKDRQSATIIQLKVKLHSNTQYCSKVHQYCSSRLHVFDKKHCGNFNIVK